jgi:hypothetical protein
VEKNMEDFVEEKMRETNEEITALINSSDELIWNGIEQWNDGFEWEVMYGFEA